MNVSTLLALILATTPTGRPADADVLNVVTWNVESGDSSLAEITARVSEIQAAHDVDAWGFSEVPDAAWSRALAEAAQRGADSADQARTFRRRLGSTGRSSDPERADDRLLLAWDDSRMELSSIHELSRLGFGHRAPLVAQFRHLGTGMQLLVMVNHFARVDEQVRHRQARLLNKWAREEPRPVIAIGDYNFDWGVLNGDRYHDAGYDLLVLHDRFRWVRPRWLAPTQCSSHQSVLDFVFVAGPAREWPAKSQVLFAEDDYCPDDEESSDHRPVFASFVLLPSSSE